MSKNDKDLVIKFATKKARDHFASWLCESGEQEYWDWMEYHEQEEKGKISVVEFDYHGDGKFLHDNTIRTTLGRLGDNRE